jgi:hypothetical protein
MPGGSYGIIWAIVGILLIVVLILLLTGNIRV